MFKESTKLYVHKIKTIRKCYHISQVVLATLINISPSTVQKSEIGDKQPRGPSLKLLSILDTQDIEILIPGGSQYPKSLQANAR